MIKELKIYLTKQLKKVMVVKQEEVQEVASFKDSKEWVQKNNEVMADKTAFENNVLNKIKTK